jgi:serine/threonine protein kinase
MRAPPSSAVVYFGPFRLDLKAGELHHDGRSVRLQEQPFRVLKMLLEHSGEVVTRDEIRRSLWPNDTIVEFDQSINAAIKKLRLALEDSAEEPRYVETVARRGYRLIVPVRWEADQQSGTEGATVENAVLHQGVTAGNLTGMKVSHYRVLEILGGGGMGVVYKAEDLKLGRRVALKFLPEELTNDPAAMERFEREARAASALNHPNICTIHDVKEHAGQPFIVMELLEGQTLRELISSVEVSSQELGTEKEPLNLETLLHIAVQAAEGLDAAHKKGIIHRDIKPANIFITTSEQAKILDFGLAKLQESEAPDLSPSTLSEAAPQPVSNLNLTRTGVAMGTAGYMSPEQVRGERLDARTDLFSFGLVLYEMAAGQRAFSGETAPILHAAILKHTPTPVRELNPRIPSKLEEIVNKALEKDRGLRYQSASEICADLKRLKQQIQPKSSGRWWKIALTALLLLGSSVTFWFVTYPAASRSGLPQLKQRQITVNSIENAVNGGAISPDGKHLAYSDAKELYIKSIESGETRIVPQPDALKDQDGNVEWEIVSWFPDGIRFLANAHPSGEDTETWSSQDTSVWIFSLLAEAPRRLRDHATASAVSPDGSLIPFETNKGRLGDREIWLMDPNGENARKLYEADGDSALAGGVWSPDGKRILYVRVDATGASFITRDLQGGIPTTLLATPPSDDINDFNWLPDGRLIYSMAEPEIIGGRTSCNFWEMRLDARTGKPVEKPRRLTSWTGFCMSGTSVTADGKKLFFLKATSRVTTYVADLDRSGTRIAASRHFTLNETVDRPLDWTADGKALIIDSDRTGPDGIYKQSLDEDNAHPLDANLDLHAKQHPWGFPRATPDGNWILYFRAKPDDAQEPLQVMRIPITGGASQLVSTARHNSKILCARPPSDLCAIAEPSEDHKQLIVTGFDPVKGRGPELTRFALDPNEDGWFLDLSPDGTRIAAIRGPASPINILSLGGEATSEVRVMGGRYLSSLNWAADGKGLFVVAGPESDGTLLYVDFGGRSNVLWKHVLPFSSMASPDGRHLAIPDHTVPRNLWMMEDF